MKWVFFTLLIINVSLAAFQWLKLRETAVLPTYVEVPEAKRILLLSELGLDVGSEAKNEERCLLLGPSKERGSVDGALKSLNAPLDYARLITQNLEKAPSYWVYLPGGDKPKDLVAELANLGLDSYVVSDGELKGNLSLGVFDNIDLARALMKKVNKKDYFSKIYDLARSETEYWLLLNKKYAAENQGKIADFVDPLLNSAEKREIFCKSVASEK